MVNNEQIVLKSNTTNIITKLLALADVKINGKRPWDIKVNNPNFYSKVLSGGSLAFGESYMDGWWDCKALDQLFYKIISAKLDKKIKKDIWLTLQAVRAKIFNLQSKKRAFQIGERHYDMGNDLYKIMLDKRMTYTGGYWKNAKTLDRAQEAKLDLVCKKLNLKPGQKILDIGCGWGSFMKFAAQKYKVKCVGLTVSKEQAKLGEELCKGLTIEFRLQDYREVNEKFDHIISLGMFEHVGPKNHRKYMEVANRCLKDKGLFLLQTIGILNLNNGPSDPWLEKYIFPNGIIPNMKNIINAIDGLFIVEDWHNFSRDYDKTLIAWFHNFDSNWGKIKDNYDSRFYRMWKYYLLCCAGAFRARHNQLWQIVLSKKGVPEGYNSIR